MASLIARAALFGNPVRTQARLSPNRRYISFLAPLDGVLNVWLAPFADPEAAKPITGNKTRGIREHYWALTGRHVIYRQDEGGDENRRALSVDVESGTQIDLTPLTGVRACAILRFCGQRSGRSSRSRAARLMIRRRPGIAAALAARPSCGAR
jgi:hypothetical protein